MIRIEYYGHSCFLLTNGGMRILTDPFAGIGYELPPVSADLVTVSHGHFDHNHLEGVSGAKKVLTQAGEYAESDVKITGTACWHDVARGAKRGAVTASTFDFCDVTVCHLGDLGERFSPERAAIFGHPDILHIPVGGNYTIDAREAVRYIGEIRPKVVIPMHYKTKECALDIAPLSEFAEVFGKDRLVSVSAFDSKDAEAFTGKAVIPEVKRHG